MQLHSIREYHRFQSSSGFRLVVALERSVFAFCQIVIYTESLNSVGDPGRLQAMMGISLHLKQCSTWDLNTFKPIGCNLYCLP